MANSKDILYTILKWSIVVITLINLILLTVNLIRDINNHRSFTAEEIVYIVLTYLIFLFGFFGAWIEEFIYLIICGVVLVLDLIFAFAASTTRTENNVVMIVLIILVFVFAFLVRQGGATSLSMA